MRDHGSGREGSAARLGRRTLLAAGLSGVGTVLGAGLVRARPLVDAAAGRSVALFNVHTGERLRAEYWYRGAYRPDALRDIAVLLRDFRVNSVHPIDPALIDLIAALHARVGSESPFLVLSGYRSPHTNAMLRAETDGVAQHSFHTRGQAIDLVLPGTRLTTLRRSALAMERGGVGYYAQSGFIHLDTGPVRHWG